MNSRERIKRTNENSDIMGKSAVLLLTLLLLTVSLAGCTEEINEQVTVNEDGSCFAILQVEGIMVSNEGPYEGFDEDHSTMDTYTYNDACLVVTHHSDTGGGGFRVINTTYNDDGQPVVIDESRTWNNWENQTFFRTEHVYDGDLLMSVKFIEDLGSEYEFTTYMNYTYDDQGREIIRYNQDWDEYTNTTYGSNGEVIRQVTSVSVGKTIENRTYDAEGNLIQIAFAFQYYDSDWYYSYENFTYENGKLIQHVDDDTGQSSDIYFTNYTYSGDELVTEACTDDNECIITTKDADGNILSEVRQNSQNEDGTWRYVFTETYTWGDPLAES